MNELQVIKEQEVLGKEFRIYGDFESPLFLARDVAEWIEYDINKVGQMLKTIDEDEKLKRTLFYKGQNREMWFLTEKGLKQVLANSRKLVAKQLLKFIDDKYKYKKTPKQTQFEIMLKSAIDIHLNESKLDWKYCPFNDKERNLLTYDNAITYETEVKIGNYRLDFYFKNFNLIVEYDEFHHKYQKEKDDLRQQDIRNILGEDIIFIRVNEGEEFKGIIKIISYLMHYAFVF